MSGDLISATWWRFFTKNNVKQLYRKYERNIHVNIIYRPCLTLTQGFTLFSFHSFSMWFWEMCLLPTKSVYLLNFLPMYLLNVVIAYSFEHLCFGRCSWTIQSVVHIYFPNNYPQNLCIREIPKIKPIAFPRFTTDRPHGWDGMEWFRR